MYLKFGQVFIGPCKAIVQQSMPADFREKFPSTRVILDCTDVFCEMPRSVLLNFNGLVGISPSGAVTFVSQLYTEYIFEATAKCQQRMWSENSKLEM